MEKLIELIKQEDADGWETLMFLYNAALKEINQKLIFSTMNFSTFIIILLLNTLNPALKLRQVL